MPDDSPLLPRRRLNRNAARPMRLEQRLMFDGAAVDTAAQVVTETTTDPVLTETLMPPAISEPTPTRQELTFVDTALADWQNLVGQLGNQVEVILLDSSRDGLSQITETLQTRSDIDALHILSHGSVGNINLGNIKLNSDTLSLRAGELESWRDHLSTDADLLLYGCDVAQGDSGSSFLVQLSSLTGADVAASTDSVGKTISGASWSLEWTIGSIESATLTPSSYNFALTTAPTLSMTTWNVIGLDSNNVNVGPNEFMVGIRVTANGDALDNYTVKLVADASATIFGTTVNASNYIHLTGTTAYSNVDIAANSYQDFYFNVSVDRNAAAYDTMLPFHFEVFLDADFNGVSDTATVDANTDGIPDNNATNFTLSKFSWIPDDSAANTRLYFYVEHLISQARNTISNQTGATGDSPIRVYSSTDSSAIYTGGTLNGPLVLFEGQQIDIRTEGATATGGYPQLTFSTVLDTDIFSISKINEYYNVPVTTLTYQQGFGSGAFNTFGYNTTLNPIAFQTAIGAGISNPNTTLYANPAGWNPYLHDLMITSAPPKAGGGPIVSDIRMTITGTGSGNLSTLILDYSGSSFHYNADAGTGVNYVPFVAVNGAITGSVKADTNLDNNGDSGINNITITLKDSSGNIVATTTTDENGNYIFKNLLPGTYSVIEGATSGYIDVRDTDGDANGKNQVTVIIGNNVLTATGTQLGISDDLNTHDVNEATTLYGYQRSDFVERAGTPVAETADVELTKTVDISAPAIGDTVTFTLTVLNKGGSYVDKVEVTDYLFQNGTPAAFTSVITSGNGSFNTSTGLWSVGSLAVGQTATLHIQATITNSFTTSITNSAEVTFSSLADPDSTPNNYNTTPGQDDGDSVTLTYGTAAAPKDVAISMVASVNGGAKSLDSILATDDTVALTVTATNQGGDANEAFVFVRVPTGLSITSITRSGTGTLEYTTSASPGSGTWTPWTNPTSPAAITGVTYFRWNIENYGSSGNAVMLGSSHETLVINGKVANGTTTPTMDADAWWTFITTSQNSADVDSSITGEKNNPTNNDLLSDDLSDGIADDDEARLVWGDPANKHVKLSLDKAISTDGGTSWDADDSVSGLRVGQLVTFRLRLTNDATAASAATGIEVSDLLPTGLNFVSAYGAGQYVNGLWRLDRLDIGKTADLFIVAEISNNIVNTATITHVDQTDDTAGNDSDSVDASISGNIADLSLDKTVSSGPTWDETNNYYTITFKLSVNNAAGGVTATNIIVKDALPSGLTYLSHTLDPSLSDSFDTVTGQWKIDSLAADSTANLYITVRVAKATSITNRAEITALDQIDLDSIPNNGGTTEDDDASATVDVTLVDLSLDKTALTTTTTISYKDGTDGGGNLQNETAGTYVVYQLKVSNAFGFDDATGVKVAESLPAGIDPSTLKYSTNGTNYSSTLSVYDASTKVWNVGTVSSGTSQTLYIRAKVSDFSKLENVAHISAAAQQDVDSTPDNKSLKPYEDDTASATPIDLAFITGKVLDDSTGKDANDLDANDTAISGVTVELWSSDGETLIATTTTDASGAYYFYAPAGTYIIRETNKSGDYSDVLAADGIDPSTGLTIPSTDVDSESHLAATNNNEIKLAVTGGNEYYGRNFLDKLSAPQLVADLNIVKEIVSVDGNTIVYKLTVDNEGGSKATGVIVTDDLVAAGLTFVGTSTNGTSWNETPAGSNGYVTSTKLWTIGDLNVDDPAKILYIKATVNSGSVSSITNTASVDGNELDNDSSDNTDSKTSGQPPIATDDSDTYTPGLSKTINVLSNDTSGDSVVASTLRFNINNGTSLTLAGEGTWVINTTTGTITFTPDNGFSGNPTPIVYRVADADGYYDTATVTLTALPIQPPPVEPPAVPPPPPPPVEPPALPSNPAPVDQPQPIPEPPIMFTQGIGSTSIDSPAEVPVIRGFPVRIEENSGPRIEHELRIDKAIPDQLFRKNQAVLYVVPTDAFVHTDPKAQVELIAKMVDGSDIPDWLTFDAKKGEFKGIPPEGFRGKLLIKVVARDDAGRTAETIVRINIGENIEQISLRGKSGLTEQLKSGGMFALKAERDKLLKHARDAANKPKATRVA